MPLIFGMILALALLVPDAFAQLVPTSAAVAAPVDLRASPDLLAPYDRTLLEAAHCGFPKTAF